MKKMMIISLLLVAVLMASCETAEKPRAEAAVVVEATIPTEYGDLTLVLSPEPELHGDLTFEFGI